VAAEVPASLRGDPGRLRQILTNLIGNAIKFTERGGIEVRISAAGPGCACAPQPGEAHVRLRCEVVDTGIGLKQAEIARLFQPFEQGDQGASRKYGGTGLGLAITKQLVELMHGRVGVVSEPGRGSCFWFEVCVAPGRSEAPTAGRQAPNSGALMPLQGRVLLVEDVAVNREVACVLLEACGLCVSTAPDGEQALAMLDRGGFDLVLMDCQMPAIDGYEATRRIRRREAGSGGHLPIVALTANAIEGDREICLAAGMDDYLAKPFSLPELHAKLLRWLPARILVAETEDA
jgi:CheY-like chemotaxis protein